MYGVCKICGCRDDDPCFHPDWGMCWWVDDTHELCSHCADHDIADDPQVSHCINSEPMTVPDLSEECWNCSHMIREENVCAVEKCQFNPKE